MTLRRFFILALMIAGIVAVAWLTVPAPVAVRPVQLAEEPWKVPVQPVFNAKDVLATLNSASLWGKLADLAQPDDSEPEWRFVGAIARGQERQVIIKKGNQAEQVLVIGDSLPGGSKILSIENDRLCLLINGQKRSLYIYPQGRLSGKMSYLAEEAPIRRAAGAAAQRSP